MKPSLVTTFALLGAAALSGCGKTQNSAEKSQFPIYFVCKETAITEIGPITGADAVIVLHKNEKGFFVTDQKTRYGNDTVITNKYGRCDGKNSERCDYIMSHVSLTDNELKYGSREHWGTIWGERQDNDIRLEHVINRISLEIRFSASADTSGPKDQGYGRCKIVQKKF